jgi:site-specific recombinase XerD
VRWRGFKSILARPIERFIAVKRAGGRKFRQEERELQLLDRYLVRRRITRLAAITPRVLDSFLVSRPRTRPRSYNHLLGAVRRLLDWLVAQGDLGRSPLSCKPRRETSRRIPFLLNPEEARRLLALAGALPSTGSTLLRGQTYHAMFAVLYALGLRIGEVCRLLCKDIDVARQLLVIRDSKFGKSRLVPFGPKVGTLLMRYLDLRFPDGERPPDAPVFSLRGKRPINPCTASQTFHALVPELGLAPRPGVAPPRLHDLRHSCAVRALLRWYRQGDDPGGRLLHLSTFLGHVSPTSTAVYLTITSELFDEASRRFERFAQSPVVGQKP